MPEIAQITTNLIVPGLDLKKIRKTDETPPRVSVYDLIGVVSKVENPRKTWQDLRTGHPETVTESYSYKADHKFPGRGNQKSPVTDARGAIMIINLLPGSMAASFRAAWADIIVRYLGGDKTLIDDIEANHVQQQQLTDDEPQRFFGQTVERDGVIRRLRTSDYPKEAFTVGMANQHIVQSGEIDLTAPQGYLGVAENVRVPPGIVPQGGIVGHFGCTHNEPTQRLMAHNGKFGFFRFIRHYPCANAYGLEQKWKSFLQLKGRLIPVMRADGTVDYESFWVHNLQEWLQFEEEFQKMCDKLVDFICRTEEKRLELKIKEAEIAISLNEARKAEAIANAEARKAEADSIARKAEAEAQTCKAELEFRKWQIEWNEKMYKIDSDVSQDLQDENSRNNLNRNTVIEQDDNANRNTDEVEGNDTDSIPNADVDADADNDADELLPSNDQEELAGAHPLIQETLNDADSPEITNAPSVDENDGNNNDATSAGPSTIPVDLFADYTREKRVKKPAVAPVPETRQRTPKGTVEPLPADKQETIDAFIANCCETGTDQKPIRDVVTQHFFEPQTSLHSVYSTYSGRRSPPKTAVKYTDFVQGLAARGIVQEFRTYPVKRNKPKGPCNRPLMSFVGIRLKSRPPSELEREVTCFLERFTEVIRQDVETPTTTISSFFKLFNAKFPGWTAYHVNQCLLSGGYKIATHKSKGERAWINLRLLNTTPSSVQT